MFFYFVLLDFVTTDSFLQIFVKFESYYWFLLKNLFAWFVFRISLLISVETGYRLVLTEFSWFEVVLSLSFEISFQSTFSTDFICLIISSRVLPWLNNLCLSSSQCWLKSFGVVRVHLILSTWLYEIFSFNDLGRSESTWRKFWR